MRECDARERAGRHISRSAALSVKTLVCIHSEAQWHDSTLLPDLLCGSRPLLSHIRINRTKTCICPHIAEPAKSDATAPGPPVRNTVSRRGAYTLTTRPPLRPYPTTSRTRMLVRRGPKMAWSRSESRLKRADVEEGEGGAGEGGAARCGWKEAEAEAKVTRY